MHKGNGTGLPLERFPTDELDFDKARAVAVALEDVLSAAAEVPRQVLQDLIQFQAEDGSFRLTHTWDMPADTRVDCGYYPTYLAAAILMRAYLAPLPELPPDTLGSALAKALEASMGRRLQGHGYDREEGLITALEVFSKGNVKVFLEQAPEVCPEFHCLVWDYIDRREALLKTEGVVKGLWSRDYTDRWMRLLRSIRPEPTEATWTPSKWKSGVPKLNASAAHTSTTGR